MTGGLMMTKRAKAGVKVRHMRVLKKDGNSAQEAISNTSMKPIYMASELLADYQPIKGFSHEFAQDELDRVTGVIKSGDLSRLEEMLYAQIECLNTLFVHFAMRANNQEYQINLQAFMKIALKAQNQSRSTIDSLRELKRPSNTQFIRQANISNGHQQVNNQNGKNSTLQNELLRSNNETLDIGRAPAPKRVNTALEALGAINGS